MKILLVANSRKTKGGITTVLNQWELMPFFRRHKYYWLETQINSGLLHKLYYMFSAYLKALFLLPKYDIIHFHTTPGNSIIVQLPIFLYAMLWNKKVILHLHVGNQLLDHANDSLFKYVLRKADKVIVLADIWKVKMKDVFNISCDVIYNPFNNNNIIASYENREPIIFYAAYLTKNKGYDLLLKAFSRIHQKYPQWKLVMAGAGEIDEVRNLIAHLKISDSVVLLPWLNKQEMSSIYNKASIYCITSYKEGFPMSALEAWSYGVPLVTTPVGGLVDVIQHRINAMVFDFGNIDELTNCLDELIENKSLRFDISLNSKNLIESTFSLAKVEKTINELYNTI